MPTVTFKMKAEHHGVRKMEHVFDPKEGKIIAIIDGQLTTEDPALIESLKRLGYEADSAVEEAEEVIEEPTVKRGRKSGGK